MRKGDHGKMERLTEREVQILRFCLLALENKAMKLGHNPQLWSDFFQELRSLGVEIENAS